MRALKKKSIVPQRLRISDNFSVPHNQQVHQDEYVTIMSEQFNILTSVKLP